MPECIFLIGIPCSGKTTWAKKQTKYHVISRDEIRLMVYGLHRDYKTMDEELITKVFISIVSEAVTSQISVIIDNTNLWEKYINKIKKLFPGYTFKYVWFEQPLWKVYWRNIWRYCKTGKWIPFSVINSMNKRYKKLLNNEHLLHVR